MSLRLRPRCLAHRGYVDAVGLLVDRADERDARARVLARWTPGTAVYALGSRYAVIFAGARRVRAEQCEGAPLVRCPGHGAGTALASTAALSRAEVDALLAAGARPEHPVATRGGYTDALALAPSSLVDPSLWIDLADVTPLDLASLGAPPRVVVAPAANPAALPGAPSPVALRAGDAPAMAAALSRALGEMVARGELPAGALAGLSGGDAPRAADGAPPARTWRDALHTLWSSLTARRAPAGAAADGVRALPPATSSAGVSLAAAKPSAPGWWARLRGWFGRTLAQSPARSVLGREQAEYLERMVEMFRRGDLDAALRHALPLGAPPRPADAPLPLTWSPPTARDALTIQLRPATQATATGGGSLQALLRTLYRSAVDKLVAEGRYDEAAFTLAELLREPGEAVALLERHGRLKLAAELADTANLPPELRVRQWVLAGDMQRAIALVRQHGVFAAALAKLGDHPARNNLFRFTWAHHLAATGDYAAALAVYPPDYLRTPTPEEEWWPPTPEARNARTWVDEWTDKLLALGGPVAVRTLARLLAEKPARFAELRGRVEALADDEGVAAVGLRGVFAQEAARLAPSAATSLAARMLARAQARDAARSGDPDDLAVLRSLVRLADEPALRDDVPTWPTFARVPLLSRPAAWRHTVAAADTGPRAVYDAVALRDGGVLLALGEAGASLRDRDGRERRLVDQPAHRIVWSDHGHAALLLGARGASWRVARLDVVAGDGAPWGECTLDAFADDYDGDTWVVGQAGEVLALDATAAEIVALPGPGRTPRTDHARVRCVARDTVEATAVRLVTVVERWRWQLPAWSLAERPREPTQGEAIAVYVKGLTARRMESGAVTIDRAVSQPLIELPHPAGTTTEVTHLTTLWAVATQRAPDAVTVSLWSLATAKAVAELRLEGATAARGRVHDGVLTVCDDRGRVLSLDLRTGTVLRDLRA